MRWKQGIVFLLLAVLCGFTTGCHAMKPIEELYELPQLPVEYTQLELQIDALLQEGAQYAAPVSGSYLQAVQMVDLNGDGHQEAVAFLRNDAQEKPLEIHIFNSDGTNFEPYATIYGNGMQIYSVSYTDLNADGKAELLVGWRVSAEVQAMSVYALEESGPRELMTSDYVRYITADLNDDSILGVVVLRSDSEGQGDGLADLYQWKDDGLSIVSSASLSITMGELSQQGRVSKGTLSGGQTALFVTGVTTDGLGIVDVLILEDGLLKNLFLSDLTGVSGVIAPFRSLYPTDMNGDGITEIPIARALVGLYEEFGIETSTEYSIDWTHLDGQGNQTGVMTTYHNADQGWYLVLPTEWIGNMTVERRTLDAEESEVMFYHLVEGDELRVAEAFLRIACYTGDNREYNALWGNQFVLSRQTNAIVTAEFYEANASWDTPLSEDGLRNAFYTTVAEWKPGEN